LLLSLLLQRLLTEASAACHVWYKQASEGISLSEQQLQVPVSSSTVMSGSESFSELDNTG